MESKTLLQGDLTIEKIQQIEAKAEADGRTSAAVIEVGGIAMYPAIIPETDDYAWTMSDIAHEWTHHYLFFAPLGRRYFESSDLTTINETVANLVGGELGAMLIAEYPPPAITQPPAPPPSEPAIDFNKTMRDLRLRVEALLQAGKIDEAELDMKQTRDLLDAHGYYIREINQAYFAFQGSYADTPGSIDPIGPKLEFTAAGERIAGRVRAARAGSDVGAATRCGAGYETLTSSAAWRSARRFCSGDASGLYTDEPHTSTFAPAATHAPMLFDFTPPSTSISAGDAVRVEHRAQAAELVEHRRQEHSGRPSPG